MSFGLIVNQMTNNNSNPPIKLIYNGVESVVTTDTEIFATNEKLGFDVVITFNEKGTDYYYNYQDTKVLREDVKHIETRFYNATEVHLFWINKSKYNPWDCAFESDIQGDGFLRDSELIESVTITDATEINPEQRDNHIICLVANK